jgi:hypothetical protein
MKTLLFPLAFLLATTLFSCSTSRNTGITDDIYFSRSNAPIAARNKNINNNKDKQQRVYTDAPLDLPPADGSTSPDYYYSPSQQAPSSHSLPQVGGEGAVINNYYGDVNHFDSDDYYDFAYSSRIRRFHNPMGFNYYDPWHTNMYFFNNDPFFWGTSIYMGYNFWNPSPWGWGMGMGMGWGGGWGMGWGSGWGMGWGSGWGMGWGMPGWGMGWGMGGGYWAGYNHGYWNGFHHGLATTNYYNSFDRTIAHNYGPRGNTTGGGSSGRSATQPRSVGQLYQSAIASEGTRSGTRTDVPSGSITGVTPSRGSITESTAPARGNAGQSVERPGRAIDNGQSAGASRGNAGATNESSANARPGRPIDNGQAAGASRGSAGTTNENGVIARPGRDGASVASRPQREAGSTGAITPGGRELPGAASPSRERIAQDRATGAHGRQQGQEPHKGQSVYGAQRPNVQPNTSPQGQQRNAENVQGRPMPQDRQNVYNSPRRNPHTYQPQAQPGVAEGRRPSYDRQPSFENRNNQRAGGSHEFGQPRGQAQPSQTQPQQRQSSPSYSQPSRQSSPSYSAPSRGSSPSFSAPSGGGGRMGGGGGSFGGGGGGSAPSRGGSAPSGGGGGRGPR